MTTTCHQLAKGCLPSGRFRRAASVAVMAAALSIGVGGLERVEGGEFVRVQVAVDGAGRPVYEQVYQAGPRDRFARSSTDRGRVVRRIDRGARLVVGYEGPEIYWMPWGGYGGPIRPVGHGLGAGGALGHRGWLPGGLLPCGSGVRLGVGVAGSWLGVYWAR